MDTILSELFAHYASSFSRPAVLLSGGIDSSTAAYYTSRSFPEYELLSMGTDRTKDREYVEAMSAFLGHAYTWIELGREDMEANTQQVGKLLRHEGVPDSLMHMSLAMGYFLTFKKAHEKGISHVITGQGPDILLAGYHKYKSASGVNHEIEKDLPLLEIDKKRDGAMASFWGITLHNPYLSSQFVALSLEIPQELKIKNGTEKFILRELARAKGLPEKIASRPKKAFQYSTGLQNRMKDIVQ